MYFIWYIIIGIIAGFVAGKLMRQSDKAEQSNVSPLAVFFTKSHNSP